MKEVTRIALALLRKKIMLWILGALGLTSGLVIAVILIVMIIIFAVVGANQGNNDGDLDAEFGILNLSPHVLQYQSLVEKYAKKEGIPEHVPIILAIMQQESGGSPSSTDPMQSSESLCGYIGCITNPEHSIQQGVKHFKGVLDKAGGDLKLAIQSYNFGGGFIDYVKKRNGKYTFNQKVGDKETYSLAVKFSQQQYQKQISLGNGGIYTCLRTESKPLNACYGDILYVWSVMQYVTPQGSGEWKNPLDIPMNITSPFGMRHHPIQNVQKMHNGVDLSCNRSNIPVKSVDDGVVVTVVKGYGGGYGNNVVVKHSNNLYSQYAHMHTVNVSVGKNVKTGDKLGTCGTTGGSSGIHLHLEARTTANGGQFDPMTLLKGKKK